MRAVELAKAAARAEVLRLQYMMKRQLRRAIYGVIAAVFAVGVLVLAHVAGWQVLRMYVAALYATLILLAIDVILAAVFGLMAVKSSPSRAEREALDVRQQALRETRNSLALTAIVPVAGALIRSRRRSKPRRSSLLRLSRRP